MKNPKQGDDFSGILQEAFWMSDSDCFAITCLFWPKLVEDRVGHKTSVVFILPKSVTAIECW